MEEPKSNHKPAPGITEALHPEIGNGSALEYDKHAFLLRSPDPSRQLEEYLQYQEGDFDESARLPASPEEENIKSDAGLLTESPIISEDLSSVSAAQLLPDKVAIELKNSKKKKPGKVIKVVDPEEQAPDDSTPVEGKSQKAGKLLRKAAKSIQKQEKELKQAEVEKIESVETVLSPFTSWLKKLAGSDYVHPYEDDFAFEQASGPGKEGISETFADLLAVQGYKDQAREMYLKLMEKYPGKSGFFAAKIEALQ